MRSRWAGIGLWSLLLFIPLSGWGQELTRTESAAAGQSDAAQGNSSLRLTRSTTSSERSARRTDKSSASQTGWVSMAGSLIIVIALIVGCGYLLKRTRGIGSGVLPDEIVQVLGRKSLDPRTTLQLVRCGSKILVLSNSVQHGVRTLSEISNPADIDFILGQCQIGGPNAIPVRDSESSQSKAGREFVLHDTMSQPPVAPNIRPTMSVPPLTAQRGGPNA